MSDVVFSARAVTFRYPSATQAAVADVQLDIRTGEMVALLGPNGSGKSTLLRLLLGALTPSAGSVQFMERSVDEWPRAELARRIGVVTQAEEIAFPLTVRELVSMGRYPHLGAWRRAGPADDRAVTAALARCGIADLTERPVGELSGGERQRARLARALAQEPRTLVFDEPTAALDLAHEMSLFELLAELRADHATILLATHNINLAARFADRLVLLDHGTIAAAGSAADVIDRNIIERVYQWPVDIQLQGGAPAVVPLSKHKTRGDA